jgi:hypothetical protein
MPAEKRYFDVSDRSCAAFHPLGRHGTKLLTPFGLATCIGVGEKIELVGGGPAMLWHPAGEASARVAPVIHGCRGIAVGHSKLDWNGPSPNSLLQMEEDVQKFLNPSVEGGRRGREAVALDESKWLNSGLFDVVPGTKTAGGAVALGVGYNARRRMLDMYFSKPGSDDVFPSFEMP